MRLLKRICLMKALIFSGVALAGGNDMQLLKVVSVKDEITVGMPKENAKGGEAIAQALATSGYVKVWQYALGRGTDGSTVQKPIREIILMKSQVLRIEPIEADQTVVPPT